MEQTSEEQIQQQMTDPEKVCCLNCIFFQARTQFCRKNPPTPVQITSGRNPYCIGMFPKIGMPALDYCSMFENINK